MLRGVRNDRKAGCYQCGPGVEQARVLQNAGSGVLIGVGSRRRSASQAIDLPSDGGVRLERLFTSEARPRTSVQHWRLGNSLSHISEAANTSVQIIRGP